MKDTILQLHSLVGFPGFFPVFSPSVFYVHIPGFNVLLCSILQYFEYMDVLPVSSPYYLLSKLYIKALR